MSILQFQPCPLHFPGLWKQEKLEKPRHFIPHGFLISDGKYVGELEEWECLGHGLAGIPGVEFERHIIRRVWAFGVPRYNQPSANVGAFRGLVPNPCKIEAKKIWPEPDMTEDDFERLKAYREKFRVPDFMPGIPHYNEPLWFGLANWFVIDRIKLL